MPDTRTVQAAAYLPRPRALTPDQVRGLVGEPDELTLAKVTGRLDRNLRRFIGHSPFVCMATTDGDSADALQRAGLPVGGGCWEGVCGTCSLAVLGGDPDHRDDIGEADGVLYPCVSRSLSPELLLDV